MALKNDHYTYRVTWSEDDQEHVGLCAEFGFQPANRKPTGGALDRIEMH